MYNLLYFHLSTKPKGLQYIDSMIIILLKTLPTPDPNRSTSANKRILKFHLLTPMIKNA